MPIELPREIRTQAVASIQRFFRENMEEPIGNMDAEALLDFFLQEIGPAAYNKAVLDVQERLQLRVSEIDVEVHEDECPYWRKSERHGKARK